MSKIMGRPLTREVDFNLIKKLIDKGFTVNESARILNLPIDTMQYYVRTRKLGKFSRYKNGFYDEAIIAAMDEFNGSATKAANKLGLPQPHVYHRYKVLIRFKEAKESRFKWLKKNYPTIYQNVKDVVKD